MSVERMHAHHYAVAETALTVLEGLLQWPLIAHRRWLLLCAMLRSRVEGAGYLCLPACSRHGISGQVATKSWAHISTERLHQGVPADQQLLGGR